MTRAMQIPKIGERWAANGLIGEVVDLSEGHVWVEMRDRQKMTFALPFWTFIEIWRRR